ncbi:hypothetical protein [Thermomonospora catenispora]|uniref:hypothetical protein n=1 Tax=Thermomonospora catenispora TaxID=2493090 RepID=UPI001122AC4E|nr:hypothetical protein [Thermomonospora catenispora]TNY36814.1 hypothetical protein EIO00_10900 [Thermomonospora catenispora]
MNIHHGTAHITHASLHGPAERTLIEPWLTEYAGLMTNAYPEAPAPPPEEPEERPATVTALPTAPGRTIPLAA